MPTLEQKKIAIIGLGYVGLPLAVEFARLGPVVGFDISAGRIEELLKGKDRTRETTAESLKAAKHLVFSSSLEDVRDCQVYIVTVPTPIDLAKQPDLTPLIGASKTVGSVVSKGDIVIYESTVFPGCTEEICVPLLEELSGLKHNVDFYTGYSPERINPGDKLHNLKTIQKVTSGSTPEIATEIDDLYASIVTAGTFKAASIEVAEAAKVIENTQRDINIALMNELAVIFSRLNIDSKEVLDAAGTKWNFLPFTPGLVGGHCIGIDPYYLAHRAQQVGYHPEIIMAGRRINDSMPKFISDRVVRLMLRRGIGVVDSKILVMGLTFKENCPDLRNSKVVEVIADIQSLNAQVDIWDPWVDLEEAKAEYGQVVFHELPETGSYDAIILAVSHREFIEMGAEKIRQLGKENHVFFDVKSIFDKDLSDGRL